MSAPSTRVVWRVLGVRLGDDEQEHWFSSAAEAYLFAAACVDDPDVEVNRVVLRPRLSRVELLQRRNVVESSSVIRPEVWRRPLRRHTRRGGAP